jgi:DNA-binding protein Fis
MAPSLPRLEDLTTSVSTSVKETVVRLEGQNGSLRHVRATVEASYIGQVMREHGGNVSRAARALGLSRPALQKKIKLYQLR